MDQPYILEFIIVEQHLDVMVVKLKVVVLGEVDYYREDVFNQATFRLASLIGVHQSG